MAYSLRFLRGGRQPGLDVIYVMAPLKPALDRFCDEHTALWELYRRWYEACPSAFDLIETVVERGGVEIYRGRVF